MIATDRELHEQLLPRTAKPTAEQDGLWHTAPVWRALTIASIMLTTLAVSMPLMLPSPQLDTKWSLSTDADTPKLQRATDPQCSLAMAYEGRHYTGRVVGLVSDAEALRTTKRVEASLGARISPNFITLSRVRVRGATFETNAALPPNMVLKVGDFVEMNSRFRDPSLPCSFIPWTVTKRLASSG